VPTHCRGRRRAALQEGGRLGGRVKEAWEWEGLLEQVAAFGWTGLDIRCGIGSASGIQVESPWGGPFPGFPWIRNPREGLSTFPGFPWIQESKGKASPRKSFELTTNTRPVPLPYAVMPCSLLALLIVTHCPSAACGCLSPLARNA
jgi:hypothetical protein